MLTAGNAHALTWILSNRICHGLGKTSRLSATTDPKEASLSVAEVGLDGAKPRRTYEVRKPCGRRGARDETRTRSARGTKRDIPASFLRFGSRKVIGVRHRAPYAKPSSPHSFETRTSRLRPTPDSLSSIEQRGHVAAQRGVTVDSLDPVPRARPSKEAAPFSTWFLPSYCSWASSPRCAPLRPRQSPRNRGGARHVPL